MNTNNTTPHTTPTAASFTPGPWSYHATPEDNANYIDAHPIFNAGFSVAITSGPDQAANARLIAAAPELLEALRAVLDGLENWVEIADEEDLRDSDSDAIDQARAAIARATP